MTAKVQISILTQIKWPDVVVNFAAWSGAKPTTLALSNARHPLALQDVSGPTPVNCLISSGNRNRNQNRNRNRNRNHNYDVGTRVPICNVPKNGDRADIVTLRLKSNCLQFLKLELDQQYNFKSWSTAEPSDPARIVYPLQSQLEPHIYTCTWTAQYVPWIITATTSNDSSLVGVAMSTSSRRR